MFETNFTLPGAVQEVLTGLNQAGFQGLVAGGAVRDLLLNRQPKDFDIATCALPEQVLQLFPEAKPTGIRFGTVTVTLGGLPIEVTTFREDSGTSDGRRPDAVSFSSDPKTDASRRDSTINALFFDGEQVLDFFGGLDDLKTKTIRAIGSPLDRIQEDKLRNFRYVRQATELGFEIDPTTYEAVKSTAHLLEVVAPETLQRELSKLLLSDHPARGLKLMQKTGLLALLLPEVEAMVGFEQHNPHHHLDVFRHTLSVVQHSPARLKVRLAALLHDVGKPATFTRGEDGVGHFYGHHKEGAVMVPAILERMRFSKEVTEDVTVLVKEHMTRDIQQRSALKKFIRRVGESNLEDLFDLMVADNLSSRPPFMLDDILGMKREALEILEAGEPVSVKHLEINGRDLMAAGFKPGSLMGLILKSLLEIVLEQPELNTKDQLLSLVQETWGEL